MLRKTQPREKKKDVNSGRHATRDKIQRLLSDLEERLGAEGGKASVADYIRLIQLERELEEDEKPTEIKVTWVEPAESSAK